MAVFRYDTSRNWYKGNTHIHSLASDGGCSFAELARMYSEASYDFLYRTDHWVASDVEGDSEEYPLLWLDGMELDGHDHGGSPYHVVCLGTFKGIDRDLGLVGAMEACRAQGGLLILAHPHWTGNSMDDAVRHGFHGVEVYNHVCRWLNGKSDGGAFWSAMLDRAPNTLGLSVDDAHTRPEHPGWNGGWVMVNAAGLSRPAIDSAIRSGNFYSTCGPEFLSITQQGGGKVVVRTSPVRFIRLVGPGWWGARIGSFKEETIDQAEFEIPVEWPYAYVEIEDGLGRRAWTNPLNIA